jgi:uncharacterized membrane protein YbhN (UPF0104 family)
LRALQFVGVLFAIWLLMRTARSAWTEAAATELHVRWFQFAVGVMMGVAGYLASLVAWHRLLIALGERPRFSEFAYVCVVSNLGRYVPGKVWQVLGTVVLAKQAGIAPGIAGASSILFVGFLVMSGSLVGLATLWWLDLPSLVLWPLVVGGLGSVVLAAWPGVLNRAFRRLPRFAGLGNVPRLRRTVVLEQLLANGAIWVLQGTAFYVFSASFCELAWVDCPRLAGAYVLSYITGLVAVFAPGGIGVREGMLGYLLGASDVGGIPVHLAALGGRVLFSAYELLTITIVVSARAWARQGAR